MGQDTLDALVIAAAGFASGFLKFVRPVIESVNILGKGLSALTGGAIGFEFDIGSTINDLDAEVERRLSSIRNRERGRLDSPDELSEGDGGGIRGLLDSLGSTFEGLQAPQPALVGAQEVNVEATVNVEGVDQPEAVAEQVVTGLGDAIAESVTRP